ncbi:C18orf63 [Branchiostoma lanceolatum]|uniref:C18orf63 protein n=1 Tax=Branchiostoma lanceolatum TaxID=7740 RepID=A0A8K0A6G9_BRALA|nr:C18orf63 [Branchiostoma lanceolatum]
MVENRHTGQALLFFSSLPDIKKLCVVTLTLKRAVKAPSSIGPATGKFQQQITKCRELIFTEAGILASPSVDDYDTINIIVQTPIYESGKLKARFEKMNLYVSEVSDVTLSLLQSCLMYTMVARLAPNWNKVGDILVQGRDFLMCKGPMNAVKVQMTACAEEVCMAIEAKTVKLPQTKLEDFAVDPQASWIFYSNPYAVISEHFIEDRWCYVLPSNKKGQVISVTRQLPENCPFEGYKDLCRHWKNTYGYRLPESEDGLFYYNVYFRPIGENTFTYPCWCVRKSDIVELMRTDSAAVAAAFLADLHTRLPSMCGHVLRFTKKPLYATARMREASTQGSSLFRGSLTAAAPPSRGSYRPVAKPSNYALTQPVKLATHSTIQDKTPCPATQPINNSRDDSSPKMLSQQVIPPSQSTPARAPGSSALNGALDRSISSAAARIYGHAALNHKSSSSVIGRWAAGLATSSHGQTPSMDGKAIPAGAKIVPIFKPKKLQKQENSRTEATTTGKKNPPHVPSFKPVGSRSVPMFKRKASAPNPNGDHQPPTTAKTNVSISGKIPASIPDIPRSTSWAQDSIRESLSSPNDLQRTPQAELMAMKGRQLNFGRSPVQLCQGMSTGNKRKVEEEAGCATPKKPRPKPKVQENVDILALAHANQLEKLNTATLMAWLREKGVTCKSKDKKGDLVQRVMAVTQITQPEQ